MAYTSVSTNSAPAADTRTAFAPGYPGGSV